MMKKTLLAEMIARGAHDGQMYGGHKYVYHLEMVVRKVHELFPESPRLGELIQVAWLHDVIEDTEVTFEELIQFGFSRDVAVAVERLSKTEGMPLETYYEIVCSHSLAFKVKVADTLANLTQSTKERQTRRILKYSTQLAKLHEIREQVAK